MAVRGIVQRTNWDPADNWTQLSCDVEIIGGPLVEAIYLTDWPPPPRSYVLLDEVHAGAWVVLGVEGGVRNVFHDDFMGANATTLGDTPWTKSHGTGAIGTAPGGGPGSVRISTLASLGDSQSWNKPSAFDWSADQSLLLTARLRLNNIIAGLAMVGFADTDPWSTVPTDAFFAFTNPAVGPDWSVQAYQGASPFASGDSGVAVVASQYAVVELLVSYGGITAAWVDGHGPIVAPGPIDNATTVPTVFVGVLNNAATTVSLHVDFIRLDLTGPLSVPSEVSPFSADSDQAADLTDSVLDAPVALVIDDQDIDTAADPNDASVGDHYN